MDSIMKLIAEDIKKGNMNGVIEKEDHSIAWDLDIFKSNNGEEK